MESTQDLRTQRTALSYELTRSDGVHVTTILEAGKAHIMEEHGDAATGTLKLLERSQFTNAEVGLLREVGAID